jgi:pyrroloquinoline quinone biosynthesis protein E
MLPGLDLPNVTASSVREIWYESQASTASAARLDEGAVRLLPERTKDFGGCRCQAYLLTGDPDNADPVASLPAPSPVTEAVARAEAAVAAPRPAREHVLTFRDHRTSIAVTPGAPAGAPG